MSSNRDVVLLAIDDATVTLGSQFREVALGLLITGLNPASSSYAWYFLAGSIPGLVLARAYAWASSRFGARQAMMATYGARMLMALGLWRVQNFWAALALLAGIATGSGFYSAAQSHYVANPGDFRGTRHVIMRLRQSESAVRLVGPMLAGLVLSLIGYRSGFLLSAGAYGIAGMLIARLSRDTRPRQPARYESIDWRPDGPSVAMMTLSFLTWQANTLAMAYTFHILHRQSFGYGLTLAVWGGSGLVASLLLSRIQVRPLTWIPPMFLGLGISWLVLSRGVSFPVFVVLGGIEGFCGWMVEDLAAALVLSQAPPGRAGYARAKLGAFEEIGSILGTVAILLVPSTWLILPLYAVLGLLGIAGAVMGGLIGYLPGRRAGNSPPMGEA
ncbi:MFS transporter [Sulfobacillus harzensis]|uniref:MFS transporter n=1 Tax=Sulfobacillus harzensis TaxID=2729629 RepID=A0A7Y0L727_9FIRM|nr:MFS transporter [Sulfobacillus harzensis]NMP24518.1 MFS transporter [Sulfobacillus harzensis]